MRVLIIGASKGTGAAAVKAALAHGHDVTAFARHPEGLRADHPKLIKVTGSFHDNEHVARAVPGHDAVIVAAGPGSAESFKDNPTFYSKGAKLVIKAMRSSGMRRLIVMSAVGAGDTRSTYGSIAKLVAGAFKLPYEDFDRQEREVRESGLEWVIARPAWLTDGPPTKNYVRHPGSERILQSLSVSRADVAEFLVEAAENDSWIGKAVQLGG